MAVADCSKRGNMKAGLGGSTVRFRIKASRPKGKLRISPSDIQWIGLRENLEESLISNGNIYGKTGFRWRFSLEHQSIETWLTWQFPKNFETGKNDWKAYWTACFPWFNRHIFKGWIPDFKAPCTIVGYPMTSQNFMVGRTRIVGGFYPKCCWLYPMNDLNYAYIFPWKKHVVDPTCCVSPMFIPSRGMLGCFDTKKASFDNGTHAWSSSSSSFPIKSAFFPKNLPLRSLRGCTPCSRPSIPICVMVKSWMINFSEANWIVYPVLVDESYPCLDSHGKDDHELHPSQLDYILYPHDIRPKVAMCMVYHHM